MSATDLFSWLPDWQSGITLRYRHDTSINRSETGNDISRAPLYDKMKRTQTARIFSPEYRISIENFLRSMHADFFQVPIFSEPIVPVAGNGLVFGDSLKNITVIATKPGLNSRWNLKTLCTHILMIDLTNQNNAELHTLVAVLSDASLEIGGAFSKDFYLGATVYYPVFTAYTDSWGDTLASTVLIDTDLVFQEHF